MDPVWQSWDEEDERPPRERWMGVAVGALAIVLGVGLWVWTQGSEGRAIQRLDPVQRHALYVSTLQALESTCQTERDTGLRAYCRQQAEFIRKFPECDEHCREVARIQLAEPAR
jgi:hypothetical protein